MKNYKLLLDLIVKFSFCLEIKKKEVKQKQETGVGESRIKGSS